MPGKLKIRLRSLVRIRITKQTEIEKYRHDSLHTMGFRFFIFLCIVLLIYNDAFQEGFKDTKGVIRIRKSKKERHDNGQKTKDKRTNNDLENIIHKTKDRETHTPQSSGMVSSSCFTTVTCRVTLAAIPVISPD